MDFRKPEEDDKGETFDDGRSPRDTPPEGSASITEETVQFGDEEVTVADALQLAGDVLMNPERHGLVAEGRVRELEEQVEELHQENDDLRNDLQKVRSDVGGLWAAASEMDEQGRHFVRLDDETGLMPESFSEYAPRGGGSE